MALKTCYKGGGESLYSSERGPCCRSTTMWAVLVMLAGLLASGATNYPVFDINTQMRSLLVPADARIGSVIYRLRATDSDQDYPLTFAATDYGSYVIRVDNLPCNRNSSYCEANVFLERSLAPDQIFKFRITVRDTKEDTTTIPVSIKVTNGVTDFNEVFPHVPGVVMIPENTKVGTELEYVIVKKHPRSLRQANLELWGSSEFKFQQSSKKDTTTGVITLASSLDYETKTMYKLSVFATGSVVMRVTARDGDKGSPRPVRYGLVSEGNPFTVFFTIDQDTGDIRLARPLQELNTVSTSHQPILLTVVAEEIIPNSISGKQEDPDLISTTATVALLLGHLQNNPPYFESHKYVTHLPENSPQGTALVFGVPYITEVRDNDFGKYGVFSLTLEKNNGTFEISPTVGERQTSFIIRVRDSTLLDYETYKQVNFKIWAKELNPDEKSLAASADVIVYLTDENDNPPVFQQRNYSANVAENSTAATYLVKFVATDQDTGDAGVVKYTKVLGLKNSSLTLHPDSGILSIATDSHGFDREESSSYQFFIEARDMKGVGNRATIPFTLNIIDVNDETPKFEKNPLDFILGQDGTNFSQRAFIKATDADAEPPNNVVRYEIVRGNYNNRFLLDAETGELLVNQNAFERFARQAKETLVSDLLVRAYDLGIPTLWSTVQVRIFPAESSSRVMRFLVPGRNPDRKTVEQLLADLTGARVVIQTIEPYHVGHDYNAARATDLTGGVASDEKSIVTANILYNNGAIVDLDKLQKHLAENRTSKITPVTTVDDSVKVYTSETRALFWILFFLILLIAMALLLLFLCCFCQCCPFYAFFSRLVRKKSAVQTVNTVNYVENVGRKENKSVQAEWASKREAWSADHPKLHWSFNRRDSERRIILVPNERQPPPNIIFTRELGSVERIPRDDLILEDVDGTEYRVLDPSNLSLRRQPIDVGSLRRSDLAKEVTKEATNDSIEERIEEATVLRQPSRDEKFIRDGNAEILRLVTRGRDLQLEDEGEEPNLNQPERPFASEDKAEKESREQDNMRRFIDESNSIKENETDEAHANDDLMKRVIEEKVVTTDVNRLTMLQRDLLLTRFLVEERRRVANISLADDTQSLPGVVSMATQTDSHAETQTDKTFFIKRKTKSDNDDSMSDSEESGRRRFKRVVRRRLKGERVVEAFQNRTTSRCEIKTPILEETEHPTDAASLPKFAGNVAPTKASLLRHAAARAKLEEEVEPEQIISPNLVLCKAKSMSEHDIYTISRHRDNVVRSLQITPVKQLNIVNNVLVENVTFEENTPITDFNHYQLQDENLLTVPQQRSTRAIRSRPTSKRKSSSEPRTKSPITRNSSQQKSLSRDNSQQRSHSRDPSLQRSMSSEKEATPRYMEWYKAKRDRMEKERKEKKQPDKSETKKPINKKPTKKKTLKKENEAVTSAIEVLEDKQKIVKTNVKKKKRSLRSSFSSTMPRSGRNKQESKFVSKSAKELTNTEAEEKLGDKAERNDTKTDIQDRDKNNRNKVNAEYSSGVEKVTKNTSDDDYLKGDNEGKQNNEDDMDSGIAMQFVIGNEMLLRNQRALEKKSIFTIAYDNMETKQIRIDTASPP
ncbi:cadherin 86C isoform X3 [Rhodnius prolixus]|uniref:cadherin 86C isoform X3 n=1 Tax=Rhodnius prolixus TaxID=13249 RepID=UPI003D18B39C